MATTRQTTDKGIGLGVLFGVLAVLGALLMYVGAPELSAAWGFAAAVTFGTVLVIAIHAYGA